MKNEVSPYSILGRRGLDAFIVVVLVIVSVWAGCAHLASLNRGHSAILSIENLYGPAVMSAAGRGFYQPDTSVSSELHAFLRNELETLNPSVLPDHIPEVASTVASYHRYLLYTVAAFWRIFGISWSSLELLVALMLGWCAAVAYGLFRLGMGRLLSIFLTLAFTLSPPMLIMLPHLRDFGKAPFILTTILLFGILIKKKPAIGRLLVLAPLMGLLIGIGMGFRQDILLFIPPAFMVLSIALYRAAGRSKWKCGVSLALFSTCLLVTAWPMLGRMEGGAQPYHPLVQGYSMKRMESLGVASDSYAPLASGHDNYVFAMLYEYYGRKNTTPDAHFEYNSPGAEAAGRQWLLDMGLHFPADIVTRGYASVLRTVRYADAYTPWFTLSPAYLEPLEKVHLTFAAFMHRFGLWLGLIALLFMGAQNCAAGLGLIIFVVYVFGYVGLQCEFRHAFHLCFVPFWLVGFLISSAAAMLRLRGKSFRLAPVLRRLCIFSLCAVVVVVAPLYVLRLYQSYRTAPVVAPILTAAREPVATTEQTRHGWTLFLVDGALDTRAANKDTIGIGDLPVVGTSLKMLHGLFEKEPPMWHTRARFMVAEFDASTMPEWLYIRYASDGAWNDFSQVVPLPEVSRQQGPVRYFFPVYELYMPDDKVTARNVFQGIGVPEGNADALRGLYEITDFSDFHFLMHILASDSEACAPLYQRINFTPDPLGYYLAENDPVGVAAMGEAALRFGRTEEAIFFCRTAIFLSNVASHRIHQSRMLARLGALDAALEGVLDPRNTDAADVLESAQALFDIGMNYKDKGNFAQMESAFNGAEKLLLPVISESSREEAAASEQSALLLYRALAFAHGETVLRHLAASPEGISAEAYIQRIEAAVEKVPELAYLAAESLEQAGDTYADKQEHELASKLYEAASRHAPGNLFAKISAAEALAASGNSSEAIIQLAAMLQGKQEEAVAQALHKLLTEHASSSERLEFWREQIEKTPDAVYARFYYGVELADAGNYGEAIQIFKKLQQDGYQTTPFDIHLRVALLAAGEEESASSLHSYLEEGRLEHSSLALQLLLRSAENLSERQQLEKATKVATEATLLAPEDEVAWVALGGVLEKQERLEEALHLYSEAFGRATTTDQLALRMDVVHAQIGDPKRRQQSWQALVETSPDNATALLHWGMACEANGAYAEARTAYTAMVDRGFETNTIKLRLGGVLACLDEIEAGRRLIEEALAADPSLKILAAWVCQNVGRTASEQGDLERAAQFYQLAATYTPADSFSWLRLGETLRLQGKEEGAVVAYRQATAAAPESAPAVEAARQIDGLLNAAERTAFWRDLASELPETLLPQLQYGFALADTDNGTEALDVANALLQEYPESPEAILLYGIALCRAQQIEEGLDSIRESMAEHPHLSGQAALHLAAVAGALLESEHVADASELLRAAVSLEPENLTYTVMLGDALFAQEKYAEAAAQFQKVLMVAPESPHSAQILDEAYKRLNTPDAHRNAWQTIADAHPDAALPAKYLGALPK